MRYRGAQKQDPSSGDWITGAILYEQDGSVWCYFWPGRINFLTFEGKKKLEAVSLTDIADELSDFSRFKSRLTDIYEAPDQTDPDELADLVDEQVAA